MSPIDRAILADKTATVEHHLERVQEKLPARSQDFEPSTDAADTVVLHLWQAIQIVIDVALAACVRRKLGAPQTYADAFRSLAEDGVLEETLAENLDRAVGFRNAIVHAYQNLDMELVYEAASKGPADLRAFLASIAKVLRAL